MKLHKIGGGSGRVETEKRGVLRPYKLSTKFMACGNTVLEGNMATVCFTEAEHLKLN